MKKLIGVLLTVILMITVTGTALAAGVTAAPSTCEILVDGTAVDIQAYNINGNNYFKLRDLAMALNGTEKQFNVMWLSVDNTIYMYTNTRYTVVGGELAVSGNSAAVTATATVSPVYLDDKSISFTAYNINNNNYFKLREVGEAVDFGVTWDEDTNTVGIDTSTGYSGDASGDSGTSEGDYYMMLLLQTLPSVYIDESYTYLTSSITTTDYITVIKEADNLYNVWLTYIPANLAVDMTFMQTAIGAFTSSPATVTAALAGLAPGATVNVLIGNVSFTCYNNGTLGVYVSWES